MNNSLVSNEAFLDPHIYNFLSKTIACNNKNYYIVINNLLLTGFKGYEQVLRTY